MSKALDALTAQVATNTTVSESAITLISGLKTQLDAAIAANETDDGDALQALSDSLSSESAAAIAQATSPAAVPLAPGAPMVGGPANVHLPPLADGPVEYVHSVSDARTTNNVMRHEYRVLTDAEKAAMQKIKDDGLALFTYIESLGLSRELSVAKTKIEEAVMWSVKHLTR